MTSTTTKTISKVAALAAGFALVLGAVAAPIAHADTTTTTTSSTMTASQVASLQAQIAALQAQLSAASGTSMSATFTRSLTIGSTGSDVTALQNWLISKGYTIPAGATGYFGAQTKAAVAAYQSAKGISPAAGYFGPITMASVNSQGGTTTTTTTTGGTTTTTTGTLSGSEGSLDNFKIVGSSNTSFNQADSEQAYGFEFKADGSDLQVNRVDYDIYNSNNQGSVRPWNIFQTATLMDGNTTVGTVDVSNSSNWSEDGTATNGNQIYRVRFDGLKDVVKMGATADYYLTLTTQNAISGSNVGSGAQYALYLAGQGVRATDAMGIQQYTSSNNGSVATLSVDNTTNGSVVISTGSDNPQTSTVQADDQNVTTGVTLNTFTLQAKNAAVTVYTIPVTVATTTSNASAVIRSLKLYQGSTLLDTESIPSGSIASPYTVSFQNLDLAIPSGTTDSFKVVADINKVSGGFAQGASVTVSVPNGNTAGFDIENGSNTITASGAAAGNPITFYSTGLGVDPSPTTSVNVTVNGNSAQQTGTFNLTFNVTAFGQDIYVSSTTNGITTPNPTAGGLIQVVGVNGNGTTTAAAALSSTADRSALNNYVIHSGQTKSITVSLTKVGQSGIAQGKLSTLLFGTSDATVLTGGVVTFPNTYQTAQQYLAD
jgi:peptidoglycan hydrolase-like protein with peptidoglycan-binding domain